MNDDLKTNKPNDLFNHAKPTSKKYRPAFRTLNNNHKGKYSDIAVSKLTIPCQGEDGYQREAVPGHASKIAAEFDWRLFGALDVVKRQDMGGRLEVADGGNRLRAAMLRGDVPDVPCIVHIANSKEEAAAIFTGINVNRRAISFAPLHKAMLMAQDHVHLLAQRAWDDLNAGSVIFEPMKPLVKFCRKKNEHEAMQRMIPVFRELSASFPRVRISADFFKGLVTLEAAIAPGSLNHPKWIKKMKSVGLDKLTDFAGVGAHKSRHPRLFAEVLADRQRINYRPNPFKSIPKKEVG